jgi:hypothetical protein
MGKRKIRDEADARECIARAKASGLEPAAWARAEGLDGRSLRAWTINLERGRRPRRRPTRGAASGGLVELVPTPAATERSAYVIRVGAVSVEVGEQFDEGTLRRVLRVLAAC